MLEDCFHLGVKGLIRNGKGELLLLHKRKKNLEMVWDLPGGRLQRGESLSAGLDREVFEETGLTALFQVEYWKMVRTEIRIPQQESDVGLILALYRCSVTDSEPKVTLSDEHIDYRWVTPAEAATLLHLQLPVEVLEEIREA